MKALYLAAALALACSQFTQAATTTIDFEGTGAPSLFVSTTPLTNHYSALGINFSGIDGIGGSILNQAGNFGFNAYSGTDFLAFNTSVGTGASELISFSNYVSQVSIWGANVTGQTMTLKAFDSHNNLLATHSINSSSTWQQLSVSGHNIASVQFSATGNYFAIDNLSVTAPVPEPETYALMGMGLVGLLAARRRKAKQARF